ASLVHNVAMKQAADGRWVGWGPRQPIEGGDIQATAYGIRVLQAWGPIGRKKELGERIAKARDFLLKAKPATTEEHVMRLFGLGWANASSEEIAEARCALAKLQRQDGGWGQLPTLPSDAYATGKALIALADAGKVTVRDARYQNGVA